MPKAVQFDSYGGIDVLQVRDVPRPVPGAGEVLVEVRAAGINPSEAAIRSGAVRHIGKPSGSFSTREIKQILFAAQLSKETNMASKPKMIRSTHLTQSETAVEETDRSPHSTREQKIRNRAYEIHLQRGGQPGYELEDWLQAERELSTSLTAVLQQLLQNTTNPEVLRQLMAPEAVYVSLNFENSELKKIMPWAGTHKGPESLPKVFAGIQSFWKTLNFKVTDTIEQGNRVAFFGSFTYKSNTTGKEITSPFSLLARFEGDKIVYLQFQEDSYGTAGSFKTGGITRFHSDPLGKEFEV